MIIAWCQCDAGIATDWKTYGRSIGLLPASCGHGPYHIQKGFWASAASNVVIYDLIQFECRQVLREMAFGWRKAGAKYNSKTKAFVSPSSMLFVLAGYGGSLHEPWVNGVWGEAKQKWNSPHPTPRPRCCLRKKDLLWQRGLTQEVNTRLRWSLQSSLPCKHSRAAVTSAASPWCLLYCLSAADYGVLMKA